MYNVYVYVYVYICIIYDFDIIKKKFEGLLELFFLQRFYSVKAVRIHVPKIFIFFICFFGGLPSRVLAGTK